MRIELPGAVAEIIGELEAAGFRAYVVGGCVRDSLFGRAPGDWDIATDALPEKIMDCFAGRKVLGTGLKHGTVTVMIGGAGYEVTTFRVDGEYSDHRRPDSVRFTRRIEEDLARRDFTVNAMAWSDRTGLVDPFGGQEDLRIGRLACVGDPGMRFREDALRILRGVRFAATLDFAVAPETAAAMEDCAALLDYVSPERIRVELDKALVGMGMFRAFSDHAAVIARVIPELGVLAHLQAAALAVPDVRVRLALLLCGGEDAPDRGVGILRRLRYDNDSIRRVELLIRYSGCDVAPEQSGILRWLRLLGEDDFRLLLEVKRGKATASANRKELARLRESELLLDDVLARKLCYRVADLAVNGRDLMELGVKEGRTIGQWLDKLLGLVIDGVLPNERDALLRYSRLT